MLLGWAGPVEPTCARRASPVSQHRGKEGNLSHENIVSKLCQDCHFFVSPDHTCSGPSIPQHPPPPPTAPSCSPNHPITSTEYSASCSLPFRPRVLTQDLTCAAPSSTLPDHAYDSLKFSPRSPINEEDEDALDKALKAGESEPQTARYIAHSRESSLEKLQSGGLLAKSSSRSHSPARAHAPAPRSAAGSIFERSIDPKVTASYGHHRQTSIVHGIQHSRNGSQASSSSSPLSPEIIAAAGAGLSTDRADMHPYARAEGESLGGSRPSTTMSGATLTSGATLPERTSSTTEASVNTLTQRRVDRIHSGRTRRDHSHHHSHSSRHHKDDQKTVGEYALHVLFTSVCASPFRWRLQVSVVANKLMLTWF